MQSVLNEILRLRNQRQIFIDYQNRNRYRLIAQENDGSKTAYCFSTPIYNVKSRKMIDLYFASKDGALCTIGSNATITVSDKVQIENAEGKCIISLPQKPTQNLGKEILCGTDVIYPTTNGIAMKANVRDTGKVSFVIKADQPFMNIRSNDKYFALMREKFRPFISFSCIGTMDAVGQLIGPAQMHYQKYTDREYELTISATSPFGASVLFEGNLYENKLFQDTTVESLNPKTNNAFGSVAFIGSTALFGEQWLYARPDYSKIPELMDKRINKAVLHIPKFNNNNAELCAFRVKARFCSFGSNWDNKIQSGAQISNSVEANGYQSIDLTPLIVDPRTRTITRTEGLILKPVAKNSGFTAIATGDSCYAPQILEINYR